MPGSYNIVFQIFIADIKSRERDIYLQEIDNFLSVYHCDLHELKVKIQMGKNPTLNNLPEFHS